MSNFTGTSRAPQMGVQTSKQLLSFEPVAVSDLGKKLVDYDDFILGVNLVQVAVAYDSTDGDAIWYRVASLVSGFTVLTDWTKLTTALTDISCVAADNGVIWYSNGTAVYKRTYGSDWADEVFQFNSTNIIALAYQSSLIDAVLYVYRNSMDGLYSYGLVDLYDVYMGCYYSATWSGHVPFAGGSNVRMGTKGKIVYLQNSYTSGSPYFFEFNPYQSGPAQKVIALDDLDDLETFALSGVSSINTHDDFFETILTGVVTRKNGSPMLVYMIGGKEFSTGLNYFIDDAGTNDIRGKLHSYGGKVWFFGPNHVYWSEGGTYLNSGERTTHDVSGISAMQVSMTPNTPFTLNLTCKKNIYGFIDAGDELDLTLSEKYSTFTTRYIVDSVKKIITDSDVSCQVSAASKWMKMLADCNSDSYYDYWSQTRSHGNPSDLTKMVRYSGLWSEAESALKLDDLNEDGILYLTDKASVNYSMRARFQRKTGDFLPEVGIVLDYQKETIADAALRLGKDAAEVLEGETRKSGIFVLNGETYYGGAGGIRVYYYSSLNSPVMTQIGTDFAFSVARDVYFQMMANFTNGYLTIYTLDESTGIWSKIGEMNVIVPGIGGQWNLDYGRAGIYMKNVTVTGQCYSFSSDTSVIPTVDDAEFPTSDTVIIDEEQIAYTGKTQNVTVPMLPYKYGKRTAYFTTITGSDFNLGYNKLQSALRIRPVLYGTVWAKAIKLWIQRIGNPLDGIEVSICDPSSSYGILGGRKITVNIPVEDVSPDGGWVTVNLGSGCQMTTAYRLQITKTRYAKTGFVSTTDYFKVKNSTGYTYASQAFNDNDPIDAWYNLSGTIAFELITFPDTEPTAPSLCVETGHGLSSTNDYYNNQALVVTSGSGVQSVTKIVRYVYSATDVCVFYIDADITPALDETSVLSVVPALTGLTRGELPAAHSGGKIDIYREGPMALCQDYVYASEEADMSLEDIVRKISRHAGVLNFSPRHLLDTYDKPRINGVTFNKRSFILHASMDSYIHPLENAVFHFRASLVDGVPTSGVRFVMNANECALYSSDGSLNGKIQGIGVRWNITSDFRFSLFDEYLSIWDGDKLFHTFILNDEDAATENDLFYIDGTSDRDVHLVVSDAYMRIDNFVLDMGKSGLSLIQQVIGNKRFFVQENGDSLTLFRQRNTINSEAYPYDRIVGGTLSKAEPQFTRICLEGGEVIEDYDHAMLSRYGNVFYREAINEINTLDDAKDFASAIISDAGNSTEPIAFTGSLWPIIQPEDICWIKMPDEVTKAIIDNISYNVALSEKEAVFDMTVQGRKL